MPQNVKRRFKIYFSHDFHFESNIDSVGRRYPALMQCLVPAKEPDVAPGITPDNTYVTPLQKPLYTKREVLKRP